MHVDISLVLFGRALKDAKLVTESVADALTDLKTFRPKELKQEWLDGLCAALSMLKKSDDTQVYEQTLALIQEGFTQQLDSSRLNPHIWLD